MRRGGKAHKIFKCTTPNLFVCLFFFINNFCFFGKTSPYSLRNLGVRIMVQPRYVGHPSPLRTAHPDCAKHLTFFLSSILAMVNSSAFANLAVKLYRSLQGPCKTGLAKATSAYDLPARYANFEGKMPNPWPSNHSHSTPLTNASPDINQHHAIPSTYRSSCCPRYSTRNRSSANPVVPPAVPSRRVIHTVGPRYLPHYRTAAENALSQCYRHTLELCLENHLTR